MVEESFRDDVTIILIHSISRATEGALPPAIDQAREEASRKWGKFGIITTWSQTTWSAKRFKVNEKCPPLGLSFTISPDKEKRTKCRELRDLRTEGEQRNLNTLVKAIGLKPTPSTVRLTTKRTRLEY